MAINIYPQRMSALATRVDNQASHTTYDQVRTAIASGARGTSTTGVRASRGRRLATAWYALVEDLRDPDIEALTNSSRHRIRTDADLARVDEKCFETQLRLHLPGLPREVISLHPRIAYDRVRDIALIRAASIREARTDADRESRLSALLLGGEVVRREPSITRLDGHTIRLRFGSVLRSIGHSYQARLHYLRSPRADTLLGMGFYLSDGTYPLTYLGFSACDRRYIPQALERAGVAVARNSVLVLTRAYALPGVPHNLMSLTLASAMRELRRTTRYEVVVTAFNPLLGFGGTTFLAAGFVPFATAPVLYRYDRQGHFTTRRTAQIEPRQEFEPPNNVLVVIGVGKAAQRRIRNLTQITAVSHTEHRMTEKARPSNNTEPHFAIDEWSDRFVNYRYILEAAWSEKTIHPSYLTRTRPSPSSKGQCGVTSVWLARELRSEFNIEATYCYGKLSFDSEAADEVDHHCWLEVGDATDPTRTIIDLTCDQAEGFDRKILHGSYERLRSQGINYEARTRLTLDELYTDRVWDRFVALDDAVSSRV